MVVILGRAARSQSRTVRWAGTKQHDGGLLDWPGSARAHRPAKTKGTAPIQTELAALFVCLRAVRPGLEQYAASSPPRLHSDTIRIHSKAVQAGIQPKNRVVFKKTRWCVLRQVPIAPFTQPVQGETVAYLFHLAISYNK